MPYELRLDDIYGLASKLGAEVREKPNAFPKSKRKQKNQMLF